MDALSADIRRWGSELGFQQIGFARPELADAEQDLLEWLARGFNGEMEYMSRHGLKRSRPAELLPDTLSVISARMDYWPKTAADPEKILGSPNSAYVSRYALGRDYHKILRQRLQRLADKIVQETGEFGYRVFTDSAPVMEKPLARNAGLGWIGKHTLLLNRTEGSWFFLAALLLNVELEYDQPFVADHCGTCRACIDVCPTGAIVGPYQLDARRCISYLTIELKGEIPLEYRKLIGNRIYGCDDCQLYCPWNKFAVKTDEADFAPRHELDVAGLTALFAWSEEDWLSKTEGSAIRRISYEQWLRNIAVALGNADGSEEIVKALQERIDDDSPLVSAHVRWALEQQSATMAGDSTSA